jgi:hypothetical protein
VDTGREAFSTAFSHAKDPDGFTYPDYQTGPAARRMGRQRWRA